MIMPTATSNLSAFATDSPFAPNGAPAVSNEMPTTPSSDVVIVDAPALVNDMSSPASEMPRLISDLPSLASVSAVRHILVSRPCPICKVELTALTSRKHLVNECGEWIRWEAFLEAISREANRTGSDSIPVTRLQWIIQDIFATTIPKIAVDLDNRQDKQDKHSHLQALYDIEDFNMRRREQRDADMTLATENVAALHIGDQV